MDMICENCLQIKEQNCFLKDQKICFHCVYKIKTSKKVLKTEKVKYCRVCKKELNYDENARKRQRNVFCSLECAEKGHKDLNLNHWTRKLRKMEVAASYMDLSDYVVK